MKKSIRTTIHKNTEGVTQEISDEVAIEEPLEFSICFGSNASRSTKNIAITMRTTGNDFELATGFLFSEGVIRHKDDILSISRNKEYDDDSNLENTVLIELNESVTIDPEKIRNFYIINRNDTIFLEILSFYEFNFFDLSINKSSKADGKKVTL